MKKITFLILFIFISKTVFTQNFVKGVVKDSAQSAVPFCALALLNVKDSSLVKGNITDSAGCFIFKNIKAGTYFLKFNNVGYKTAASHSFDVDSLSRIELPAQILNQEGISLKEVSVAVFKPAIEFKKGMVVMNVENDLLAKGNTVLELLKRIPGVIVDAQNNITINGVGGARFLIDDRLQQMPAAQVIDMLSGMSADAVSKIEIIKNPPARYDAAGTGGVINIVTKKAKVKGYSGNAVFGASQGQRLRWGPFISLNYKSNKLSLFSNFSYGHWDGINYNELNRTLFGVNGTEFINSRGRSESFQRIFSGNAGIEYDLTKKTVLGFYVNGNHNNDSYVNNTQTGIANGSSFGYGKLVYSTNEDYSINNPNFSASILQKIDSVGGQVKLSAGYNNYTEKYNKLNQDHFYDSNDFEVAPSSNYNNYASKNFKVLNQKLDLNKTFKNKISLESGFKSSFVNNYNNNELQFSNHTTGLFTGDTIFYNGYRYKERILAAYSTIGRSWEKIGFSLGIRAEQTDIHANDLRTGYVFNRNYFNLFPSGSIDFTINKKNTITTAYSYRIDRPDYGMLNPIRIFNEQLNYSVGNSELKPQYTHNITIDYNYNQFITQGVGMNLTNDFTFFYSYTPAGSKVNIDTISNIAHRNNYYYNISVQKRVKWYNFQVYGIVMYRTLEGQLRGENVSSQTMQFYFNTSQEIYLPKEFKIQIWAGRGSGFKDGPQYYYPRSAIHLSVNKSFLDKKLNITLSLNDVLYKDFMRYSTDFYYQQFYFKDRFDTRRFRISINYRFGKMRIEQRMNSESDSRLKGGK